MISNNVILGAGMTGLSSGIASNLQVFESTDFPGGICSSYYMNPYDTVRLTQSSVEQESYRFELGGGHWIFGGDPAVQRFIRSLTPVKSVARLASVFFSRQKHYVPYPIQNHLAYLGKDIVANVLIEISTASKAKPVTMADWIQQSFGKTLTNLFFAPFNQLYTADLWTRIAPQDDYKSPVDMESVLRGAFEAVPPVGYNIKFVYPGEGLDALASRMAKQCKITYTKKVVQIDTHKQEVHFADGTGTRYESLISTLPLNQMMMMSGLEVDSVPDPYTSVLVLNIGATRAINYPNDQWLYIPDSKTGFHRVGFYDNVDVSFLPLSSRSSRERVGLYVERAYPGGHKPTQEEISTYAKSVVSELQDWGFIGQVEVIDPTWIEVAYTWSWPKSQWKKKTLDILEKQNIYQVGRYGRWVFQGIADSIRDGLIVGGTFK